MGVDPAWLRVHRDGGEGSAQGWRAGLTAQEGGVPGRQRPSVAAGGRTEGSLPGVDVVPVRFRGKRAVICRHSLDSQMDSRHNPARKIGFVDLPLPSL